MNQNKNRSLARTSNSMTAVNRTVGFEKVTQLSRLSSTFEPLEARTMMSTGTLALPVPPLLTSAKVSNVKLVASSTPKMTAAVKSAAKPAVTKATAKTAVKTVVPPLAPTSLTALGASTTQMKLTWTDNSPAATGYFVFRSTDGMHFTRVGSLSGASASTFTDSGLISGSAYKYEVEAYANTVTSAPSSIATGVTSLSVPTGLIAAVTSTSPMHLSWADHDSSATGYLVLRSTDGVHFTQIATLSTADAVSFEDKSVLPSTKYFYQVQAKTSIATSATSNIASATTPLGVPTSVSVIATGSSSVKVAWTDNDPGAKGFFVYRSSAGSTYAQVGVIGTGTNTTWTDTTVSSATSYSYEVKATNGTITSALSTAATVTTPLNAPTGLAVATLSTGGIGLTWADADASATGYTILRSTDGVHFTTLTILSSSKANSYTDNSVSTGRSYSYQVIATTAAVSSAPSNTASVITPLAAPFNLVVKATSNTIVSLTWTDSDSGATGYSISRSTDGTTYIVIAKLNSATASSYSDTTASSARTYYYQVQAFNTVATSATVTASPVVTPLLAPTGLIAVATGTSIGLSWTNKDSGAAGYLIFRSTDGSTFTQLAQINSPTVTSYNDISATAGQKYYYQVQAVSGSISSTVSNLASATVTAVSPAPSPTNSTVTIATRYGNELVITLTGTNDTVSISQSGSTLTVVADGQTTTQPAPTAGLFIYTRGGTDGISVDQSVTVRTTIEAIDASVDNISSTSTSVSVWDDSNDIFTGSGTVHSVNSFAGGVSKATAASLKDPSDASTIMHASSSLWGTGPVAGDVNQGNSGDCYFLSSLAAFAGVNPSRLEQSAVDMGDGTYTVSYVSNGTAQYVRVSNDLPTRGNGSYVYARPGSSGSIWATIMEKAYAYFRTGANTYASISSGWMGDVYSALGVSNTFYYTNSLISDSALYSRLAADLAKNKAVTLGTNSSAPGLVSGHAYTLVSVSMVNGVASYVVRNPWGVQGDALETSQGYATLTYSQMEANFLDVCEATA